MNMKTLLTLLVATTVTSSAMASSKVCFGSTKSEDTKGAVLKVEVREQTVSIKAIKGNYDYDSTYPAYNTSVHGRDGKTYLEYKGENSDYQDVIMVDEALLQEGTTGLLQIRARGEGFFNSVFVCRDAK
jgi:hypothetical protein